MESTKGARIVVDRKEKLIEGAIGQLTPNISHPVAGWEDCRGCHDRWEGKDVEIPNLADSD